MFIKGNQKIIPSQKILKGYMKRPEFKTIKPLKAYLKELDEAMEDTLQGIDLPQIYFVMEPLSLSNIVISLIIEAYQGFFPNCRVLYSAVSNDGTAYLLDLTFDKDNEDEKFNFVTILMKKNKYETAQIYNMNTKSWDTDCNLDRILNAEINDDPESSLIDALENGLGMPIAMCGTKSVCLELDRNRKLIDLASKLDGKGKLKLLDIKLPDEKDDLKMTPVITASDMFLFGTAVMLDDDGNYSLCSFDSDAEIMEKSGLFYVDVDNCIKEIMKPDDEKWLTGFLKKIWSSKDDGQFHQITPLKNGEYTDKRIVFADEQEN